VVDAYQRRHPALKIDLVRAGTGEMLARARAEKDNPIGDVLWGGSLETYSANADLFAPLDLESGGRFSAADPARKWHPFTANVIYLVANRERLREPPPASFLDLADPRWRELGGVALSNPGASGTGYTIVSSLASLHGWDYVGRVLRNCRLTDSSDSMFRWVKDGETALGFLFETTLRDAVAAGAPLAPVITREGLIVQTDGFGMISGARHPQAAADFMRYLASEEAQEVVRARVGRRSARQGMATPPGLRDLAGTPLVAVDPRVLADRPRLLALFDRAREQAGR
jgi:iron(III) transport system substrate-binding protein